MSTHFAIRLLFGLNRGTHGHPFAGVPNCKSYSKGGISGFCSTYGKLTVNGNAMPLTPKQKAILDFITSYCAIHGFAPSQPEIANYFGYRSLGTVQDHLVRLRKEGFLGNTPHARRGLSVKTKKTALVSGVALPLLGRVAAGKPIEVIESHDQIDVPASFVKRGEHFVLEVMGNSMIEDGILHRDFVIVKKQRTAERGQMVIALVNDAATVKRFYPKNGVIELHPANPQYRPIIVSPDQSFYIEGVVVGVIRRCG